MATLKTADIHKALVRKGAVPEESHHVIFRRYVDGKLRATTRISHGATEIGSGLISAMATQCKISTAQFKDLVACTFTQEQWDAEIRSKS